MFELEFTVFIYNVVIATIIVSSISNWLQAHHYLAEWFSSISTFLAVFVALFGKEIIEYWKRPILQVDFEGGPPYVREAMNASLNNRLSTWVRLKILNDGRTMAHNCEVKLNEIRDENGISEPYFDPIILHWVGGEFQPININRREFEYVDLFFTDSLDGEERLFIYSDRGLTGNKLLYKPGIYYFKTTLYGENFEPITTWFKLSWNGIWRDIQLQREEGLID